MAEKTSLNGLANLAAADAKISRPEGYTIMELGPIVLSEAKVTNAFINSLVNRIYETVVHAKMYKNDLAKFKKNNPIMGIISQQLFVNPTNAEDYNMNAIDVFSVKMPDVKAVYFSQNSEKQFPVTIYKKQLKQAFVSESAFQNLVDDIISQLYNSKEIYEFERIKYLINKSINVDDGNVATAVINQFGAVTKTNVKDFLKICRGISINMGFPSTNYNNWAAYAKIYNTKGGIVKVNEKPAKTMCKIDRQHLIIRADLLSEIDVEAFASAFNLDKMSFLAKVTPVDNFLEQSTDKLQINALICDEGFIHVTDNDTELTDIFNPKSISYNYFLTTFQTYGTVPFANAVAFVQDNPDYVAPPEPEEE